MRLLVDELPETKEKCPFYRKTKWLNDCVRTKDYCTLKNEHCDLRIEQKWPICCSALAEVREYD